MIGTDCPGLGVGCPEFTRGVCVTDAPPPPSPAPASPTPTHSPSPTPQPSPLFSPCPSPRPPSPCEPGWTAIWLSTLCTWQCMPTESGAAARLTGMNTTLIPASITATTPITTNARSTFGSRTCPMTAAKRGKKLARWNTRVAGEARRILFEREVAAGPRNSAVRLCLTGSRFDFLIRLRLIDPGIA